MLNTPEANQSCSHLKPKTQCPPHSSSSSSLLCIFLAFEGLATLCPSLSPPLDSASLSSPTSFLLMAGRSGLSSFPPGCLPRSYPSQVIPSISGNPRLQGLAPLIPEPSTNLKSPVLWSPTCLGSDSMYQAQTMVMSSLVVCNEN